MAIEPIEYYIRSLHPTNARIVAFSYLSGYERYLVGNRRYLLIIARGGVAGVAVRIDMPRGGKVIQGVRWLIYKPSGKTIGILKPSKHNHITGACAANGIYQALHANSFVRYPLTCAAIFPTIPSRGCILVT